VATGESRALIEGMVFVANVHLLVLLRGNPKSGYPRLDDGGGFCIILPLWGIIFGAAVGWSHELVELCSSTASTTAWLRDMAWWGLGDRRGLMVSHRVETWSSTLVALTIGLSRAMRIFALKMGQPLMTDKDIDNRVRQLSTPEAH
jgi:hypothetical protein